MGRITEDAGFLFGLAIQQVQRKLKQGFQVSLKLMQNRKWLVARVHFCGLNVLVVTPKYK